eukprot:TRINITY_DN7596_c0_g1_i5.p5 TRINITY_DN7596_c0_g1~~TRINITY_DN7596_c0_g1_i5.p5  ORF type:complete len:109 (+),score=3.42 TRINITY_DN7596_c0_g1_i5:1399-1725(+)
MTIIFLAIVLSSTLWIGSIPRDAPSVELERLLEPYGPRDIKHLYERQQAFVIVKSRQSAEHAVRYLDGFDMQGSRLKVYIGHRSMSFLLLSQFQYNIRQAEYFSFARI